MATKDTDPVVPSTQPRTSQGEAASGLPEAVVFPYTTPVPAPTTNGANGCGTGFIASRASLARHLGINLAESDARARSLDAPATYERSDTTREAVESWLAIAPEATGTLAFSPPYTTPVPTLHDGSTGWVYCEACDAPQPVAGHECPPWQPIVTQLVQAERERLDLAESLLCAMAFDHKRELWIPPEFGGPDVEGHDGFWVDCQIAVGTHRCVYCEAEFDMDERTCDAIAAAHGGGR